MAAPPEAVTIVSATTVVALAAVSSIVGAAYLLSRTMLPAQASGKIRLLFIWHMFDAMVHFILEGSFLYHCFFTSIPMPSASGAAAAALSGVVTTRFTPEDVYFLGDPSRLHGSFYSDGPMAMLWKDYARADRRWGGTDLTIISLELLTVFVMGPLAIYVCSLLARGKTSKAWFWMVFIATGELYGGFMTFAPEWLTGSPNLDSSNFMFLWVYLIFFNAGLWVVIPSWVLWEAYNRIQFAIETTEAAKTLRSGKKVT